MQPIWLKRSPRVFRRRLVFAVSPCWRTCSCKVARDSASVSLNPMEFLDQLPKSPIGKILRRKLKEEYASGGGA